MDRWHAMKVFLRVAEGGGFAEAARLLNMSPAAVTRAIASLEGTIGARLFIRSTRAVKLTEAGSRYFQDCRRIMADIDEAEAAAAGSFTKPSGLLTVTAPVMFGQIYVLPILVDFLRANLAVTGRTLFLDRTTHLIDEGIDVAIRIGHLPDSGLRAIPVGSVRRVICGSPAYFEAHGEPAHPSELTQHTLIAATSAWTSPNWRFRSEPPIEVTVNPRLFCNTNQAAISAATEGWGLTRLLSYQVASLLERGQLKTVLGDFEEDPLPIHVVHSEGRHAAAKVRSFIDFAVAALRGNPLINRP